MTWVLTPGMHCGDAVYNHRHFAACSPWPWACSPLHLVAGVALLCSGDWTAPCYTSPLHLPTILPHYTSQLTLPHYTSGPTLPNYPLPLCTAGPAQDEGRGLVRDGAAHLLRSLSQHDCR